MTIELQDSLISSYFDVQMDNYPPIFAEFNPYAEIGVEDWYLYEGQDGYTTPELEDGEDPYQPFW